jgi:hypothetical protein
MKENQNDYQFKNKLHLKLESKSLKVSTPYWTVEQEADQGWCITSIKVKNGRNSNILRGPVYSSFACFMSGTVDYPEFSDKFDRSAKLVVKSETREKVILEVTGRLVDRNNRPSSVLFEYLYIYHCCGSLTVERRFKADAVPSINKISVGVMQLAGTLNEYGVRESYDDFLETKHSTWTKRYGVNFIKWHKLNTNAQVLYNTYSIPTYFSFFERGVEGIDIFPGSNIHNWWIKAGDQPLDRRTSLVYTTKNNTMTLSMDPLFETMGREPDVLDGQFAFRTVIGLPHKEKKISAKLFHTDINSSSWPTRQTLKQWADSGINLIRLHDDGYKEEGFWRDGSYPPYDKKNMLEMDRVIKQAHELNIKIIPYFSLLELHKDVEEFKKHWLGWRKVFRGSEEILFTQEEGKGFGGLMCLQSGWFDFLKKTVTRVLENHGFDGIYYDWCYGAMVCDHAGHAPGRHTMIEEMIELVYWTRNFIGKDKILMVHQSPSSLIPVENMADAVITLEELKGDDYFLNALPHPTQLSPHCTFIGIRERQVCTSMATLKTEHGKNIKGVGKAFIVRCALNNLVPYGNTPDFLKYFSLYSKVLSECRFLDADHAPFGTDNPNVLAVYYEGDRQDFILTGNLSDKKEKYILSQKPGKTCITKQNKTGFSLDSCAKVKRIPIDKLASGISDTISANSLKVYVVD